MMAVLTSKSRYVHVLLGHITPIIRHSNSPQTGHWLELIPLLGSPRLRSTYVILFNLYRGGYLRLCSLTFSTCVAREVVQRIIMLSCSDTAVRSRASKHRAERLPTPIARLARMLPPPIPFPPGTGDCRSFLVPAGGVESVPSAHHQKARLHRFTPSVSGGNVTDRA